MANIERVIIGLVLTGFTVTAGYAQPLGSPNLEAGLAGRTDVVFFTDFESEDWTQAWEGFGHKQNMRLVNNRLSKHLDRDFSGKALEISVHKGEHYGLSGKFVFKDKLGYEPEELYVRFYTYYARDFGDREGSQGYRGGKQPAYHDHHVYLDNLVITTGARAGRYTPLSTVRND